jgi:glycosyltransferase involved in cell wall biosynthesis
LVSITIPTYNRARLLTERALPSCLAQTHQNIEIIVVGDGCTDDTAARVRAMGDPRITFINLAQRGDYPTDPVARWHVAGTAPANEAARRARGAWIAPLDDDDAFNPTHIEDLLAHAHQTDAEMVYGITNMQDPDGSWKQVGEWPPRLAGLCRLAVMYRRDIGFFEHRLDAWKRDEPGDWHLWRRMQQAGVRMAFLPKVVATHYAERSQLGR